MSRAINCSISFPSLLRISSFRSLLLQYATDSHTSRSGHRQRIHSLKGDKNYHAYMKPEYFDAHLNPLGWREGVRPCDKRRSIRKFQSLFPAIDFYLVGARKKKEIAIVTHRAFGNYSHPLEKEELSKLFANCEFRPVVIVDCYCNLKKFKSFLSPQS